MHQSKILTEIIRINEAGYPAKRVTLLQSIRAPGDQIASEIDQMLADGLIEQDQDRAARYWITDKGGDALAKERAQSDPTSALVVHSNGDIS